MYGAESAYLEDSFATGFLKYYKDRNYAFAALLPSCSAVRRDARLQDALHDTLVRVAGLVPVGWLECLPDREAARLCLEELNQIIQQ